MLYTEAEKEQGIQASLKQEDIDCLCELTKKKRHYLHPRLKGILPALRGCCPGLADGLSEVKIAACPYWSREASAFTDGSKDIPACRGARGHSRLLLGAETERCLPARTESSD